MNKVVIVGNSGSGKTWLGMRGAAVLGIPHVELDAVFWVPGGFNRKRRISDVEACHGKIQASPRWLAVGGVPKKSGESWIAKFRTARPGVGCAELPFSGRMGFLL
jgi:hypothetical protein